MGRELQVEWDCLVWLNSNGWYAWKNASTGTFDVAAGAFRKGSVFQIRGVSDIIALKAGAVVFIEVKNESGEQSKDQVIFQKQVERRGGHYTLVRSVDELKKNLASLFRPAE